MSRLSGLKQIAGRFTESVGPKAKPVPQAVETIRKIVHVEAPEVEDFVHWSTYVEATPLPKPEASKQLAIVGEEPTNIAELIPLALQAHYKILKHTRLVETDEDYVAKAKLVLTTAQSVLSTQIKVDENQLKHRKQEDIMTILDELRAEEKRQGALELSLVE